MKQPLYIVDALRTAVGSPYRGLKDFTAAQLAGVVIEQLLAKHGISGGDVDEVMIGNAVAAATGQNLARQAAAKAQLPNTVPAYVVNQVCGGGLQAMILAARAAAAGEGQLIVAGGTESASHCPNFLIELERGEQQENRAVDAQIYDGLWCHMTNRHMGELAEILVERYGVPREGQDDYALASHRKAAAAQQAHKFEREIVPVPLDENKTFADDERVRKTIDIDRLRNLPPAFKEGGTVTAGNSSVPSDGASAVLLATEEWLRGKTVTPRARLTGYASVAGDPLETFALGVTAVQAALKAAAWSVDEVDIFEIAESFAAQAIYTRDTLKIPEDKMNVWGGDIALGHPLGAAGTRLVVTLLNVLEDRQKKRGLSCICFGGGGAIAVAIER